MPLNALSRHRLALVPQGAASRGLLAIVGGTGAGQLVALLSAPLLGRLYPPSDYGAFATVNAILLPLGTVAALRYDLAVPVAVDDEIAGIVIAGAAVSVTVGSLGTLVVLALQGSLAGWIGLPTTAWPLLLWAPLIAALMGVFVMLNQVAIRHRRYEAIARRNVLQSTAVVVLQVLLGWAGLGPNGLAMGLAGGQAIGVLALAHSLRDCWTGGNMSTAWAAAWAHRRVPMLLAPSGLINTLGLQAPVLIVSATMGAASAGALGMAQRILALPVALVGTAVAQVYLGEFGALDRAGAKRLEPLFMRSTYRLAAAASALVLIVMSLAPWGFSWALGQRWSLSGDVARALAIGVGAQLVAVPLSQSLIVLKRFHWQLAWDVSRLVLCSVAVFMGVRLGLSLIETMWLLGGAMASTFAASWGLSRRALQLRDESPIFVNSPQGLPLAQNVKDGVRRG